MNNSWNLKGDAQTYQKYDKGWANEDGPKPKKDYIHPPKPVLRSGLASRDNPLAGGTNDYYKPNTTASRVNAARVMYSGPPMEKEKEAQMEKEFQQKARREMPPRNQYQGGYNPNPTLPSSK